MYVDVKVLWKRYKRSVIKKTGQVNIKRFPRYCLSGQGRIKGNTPFEYKELGFWSKLLLLPPYFEDKIKPCYGSMVLYNKSLRLLWIYLLHNHRWPNDKKRASHSLYNLSKILRALLYGSNWHDEYTLKWGNQIHFLLIILWCILLMQSEVEYLTAED